MHLLAQQVEVVPSTELRGRSGPPSRVQDHMSDPLSERRDQWEKWARNEFGDAAGGPGRFELDQPLVADPEVIRNLMEHDVPDLAA
jgi:hypothetical protein